MAAAITVERENQAKIKRDPPEVDVKVLELENLPSLSKPWKDIKNQYQPVDVLLLTVKDCEFLSCLSYLNEGFVKSNPPTLGTVYFGSIGDHEVVKVAVMKCDMGSSTPGGSLVVVPKAVRSLRPKAVFNVGFCASLNEKKAKLGDVVVCSKLITYAFITRNGNRIEERGVKVPLKRDLANLVKNIGDGWKPPLKNSTGPKVEPRKDGVFLSGPEVVNNGKRRAELIKRFPEATAIEMEGEDLVKAGTPSDDELEELSLELGEKWEELAGRLGYNQAARSNFYANNRSNNRLARSAYSMLLAWKQRGGSKATYKVLYDALCHKLVQCNLLAQKFCCE